MTTDPQALARRLYRSIKNNTITKDEALAEIQRLRSASAAAIKATGNYLTKHSDHRFTLNFTGDEFYLADHVIGGNPLLPGVMYLDMVMQALEHQTTDRMFTVRDLVWIRPLIARGPQRAQLTLQPGSQGTPFSVAPDTDLDSPYCQGSVDFSPKQPPPRIDLHHIQARCNQGHLDTKACYQRFHDMGLGYGPGQQSIRHLQWGTREALGHLALPEHLTPSFLLHPSIMDGAMQTCLGLALANEQANSSSYVPFSIGQVQIHQKPPAIAWAWTRPSAQPSNNPKTQYIDIDVCDEHGTVCVTLKRISTRVIEFDQSSTPKSETPSLVEPTVSPHFKDMDQIAARVFCAQLIEAGLPSATTTSIDQVIDALGVDQAYRPWLTESLRLLMRMGLLENHSGSYQVLNPEPLAQAWQTWKHHLQTWAQLPDVSAQATLLDACLTQLPDVLQHHTPATDVLFPDSSMALVENVYKNNDIADFYNHALIQSVVHSIQQTIEENPNAKIRLLEVGAGTGGTSARLFEALTPFSSHIDTYCYTDVSNAFLIHAKEHYGPQVPYLTYQLFNAEQHPALQRIESQSFDLVIAANVLHATRNISQTLDHIKAMLKPEGCLFINEIVAKSLFTHFTFGLLEGWWRFEDPEHRLEGSPALSMDHWRKVLQNQGYMNIQTPLGNSSGTGQQIITAQSDGVLASAPALSAPHHQASPKSTAHQSAGQTNHLINTLLDDVAQVLKMSVEDIDPQELLSNYGVDSILTTRLSNQIKTHIPEVNAAMLYEYGTIDALAQHLATLIPDTSATPVESPAQPVAIAQNTRPAPQAMGRNEDIAIIGVAGRYPGARNLDELWDILSQGKSVVSEIPKQRWDWKKHYNPDPDAGEIYSKWGSFIKDAEYFDANFFDLSAEEATWMDPQERLLLETAYECLEDAGHTADSLSGQRKVGVFVGVTNGFYDSGPQYFSMANRISYHFDLKGPSFAVDSACSSSLTGLHLAVESLHSGTSDCALVGGVNLILDPKQYQELCAMGMISPTQQCKAFSEHADGFVDGEGVGVLLLKPLNRAITDGDNIHGVIKATMINSSGRTNRYATPKASEQTRVISDAVKKAGIDITSLSYIEAHGSGTLLGDSMELMALNNAFRQHTDKRQHCPVGSYKPNIGYCESASGVAGISKVLLQFRHQQIAPSIHCDQLNSQVDFEHSAVYIQRELGPWIAPSTSGNTPLPRRAGVSSFGATGSNAHVILEEYVSSHTASPSSHHLIVLSAKTAQQLTKRVRDLLEHLTHVQHPIALPDLAYTLQVGREHFAHRVAFVCDSDHQLIQQLDGFLQGKNPQATYHGTTEHQGGLAKFAQDDAFNTMMQQWWQTQQHEHLAELWAQGAQVPWQQFNHPGARRISLPTYPFEGQKYWLGADKASKKEGIRLV